MLNPLEIIADSTPTQEGQAVSRPYKKSAETITYNPRSQPWWGSALQSVIGIRFIEVFQFGYSSNAWSPAPWSLHLGPHVSGHECTAPVRIPYAPPFQLAVSSWGLSSVHSSLVMTRMTYVPVCPEQPLFTHIILKWLPAELLFESVPVWTFNTMAP